MAGVSHVMIDEVHERDVDTDFLLVVVRELLNHHPSLRVVVMSATLDASVFTRWESLEPFEISVALPVILVAMYSETEPLVKAEIDVDLGKCDMMNILFI